MTASVTPPLVIAGLGESGDNSPPSLFPQNDPLLPGASDRDGRQRGTTSWLERVQRGNLLDPVFEGDVRYTSYVYHYHFLCLSLPTRTDEILW